MRILLDAHVSGRVVGDALRGLGHDVMALDEDATLEGLPDPAVVATAVAQQRVLVTANVRDFVPLLAERLGAGRSHSGCVLIPNSVQTDAFGPIITGLDRALARTDQHDWIDRTVWLPR